MGTGLKAHCVCGYDGSASVGSTRAGHGKFFWYPHRCSNCRAVVVADLLAEKVVCPQCGSVDIAIYEASTKRCGESLARLLGPRWMKALRLHKGFDEAAVAYCFRLDKTFYLMKTGNTCPVCLQDAMQFTLDCQFD